MYFPPSTFSWNGWSPVLHDFSSSLAGVLCWLGAPALLASHRLPSASSSSSRAAPQQLLLLPQKHWQGLPSAWAVLAQPQHPRLVPCLCTHISFQRDSWNTAGSDATHPYSRDTAAARGGRFILWISPTLNFALQYAFSEVLQLWWQHSTELICC